jgi:hypothetical protein
MPPLLQAMLCNWDFVRKKKQKANKESIAVLSVVTVMVFGIHTVQE